MQERLFLVKKVKTSFYHDLMIYTKRDASLTSEASDRRPFECKSSKSDRKTLLFLQDVFFFNFRGFQTSRHLLIWFCGECQKSHLEIRSSYGSRDSFSILVAHRRFWSRISKTNPSGFFGMVDRFFKHPKNRERVLQGGKGMQC